MDKCKYDELVYMHTHVHTHYVCHTPSNYNIVTNRQAEPTVKPDHWQRYRNIVTDFHTISRYKKKPEIQALHSRVQLSLMSCACTAHKSKKCEIYVLQNANLPDIHLPHGSTSLVCILSYDTENSY